MIIKIFLIPNASSNEIVGPIGDPARLKIKVTAKANNNQANTALIKFMAKHFKIAKSEIKLLRGHKSRNKDLLINISNSNIEKFIKEHEQCIDTSCIESTQ